MNMAEPVPQPNVDAEDNQVLEGARGAAYYGRDVFRDIAPWSHLRGYRAPRYTNWVNCFRRDFNEIEDDDSEDDFIGPHDDDQDHYVNFLIDPEEWDNHSEDNNHYEAEKDSSTEEDTEDEMEDDPVIEPLKEPEEVKVINDEEVSSDDEEE